jgi:hypothetical protein
MRVGTGLTLQYMQLTVQGQCVLATTVHAVYRSGTMCVGTGLILQYMQFTVQGQCVLAPV